MHRRDCEVLPTFRYPNPMRFHALQTDPRWLDVAENRCRIVAMLDAVSYSDGDYVVLPEMCETGWSTDAAHYASLHDSPTWFAQLAATRGIWIQAGYAEHLRDGRLANCVAVIDPKGVVRGTYRKNFLFPSERTAFVEGSEILVVETGSMRVCPLICYDLRFPELWRLAALAGAEVFAVSSSWPAVRHEHWRSLLVARAIENQACVIAANRTGNDPSAQYVGGSVAINALGVRLEESGSETRAVSATFDRGEFDAWRMKFGALRDTRASLLGSIDVARV